MGRIDVRELEDSPHFPAFLRDAVTGYLRLVTDLTRVFEGAGPPAAAAAPPPRRALIDLCSGGGGALVGLAARGRLGRVDTVLLTDLFPNAPAFAAAERRLPPGVAHGVLTPVDAGAVPPGLLDVSAAAAAGGGGADAGAGGAGAGGGAAGDEERGRGRDQGAVAGAAGGGARHPVVAVRTMFNALHHLPPPVVMRVLADAAAAGQPIAAFEVVERHPITMLAALAQAVAVPFLLPFLARPPAAARQAARLLAALPAAPLVVAYDGFMSCLRAYSIPELRAFAAAASTPDYVFSVGAAPRRLAGLEPFRLTWIEGAPAGMAGGAGAGAPAGAGAAAAAARAALEAPQVKAL
ncbi:MAG: hypothetical protein J3K34DRAFT_525018 [Monoraphidium minutum]|nr:MAG: hypothetical protein J3K34DRAFT_525018 [Monoraphidium minutum]